MLTETLHKRACRYLLHRYLGHVLTEKLTLDQLSVDIFNGHGTLSNVNLDVNVLNEHVPDYIRIHDGYIGTVNVEVPWTQLLEQSSVVTIDALEITVALTDQMHGEFSEQSLDDEMGRMFASVMSSMTTSIDIARTAFCAVGSEIDADDDVEQSSGAGASIEGVERFAVMIDSVLSRIKFAVTNVVVRLERMEESGSGKAVELRIDKITCVDESVATTDSVSQQGVVQHQPGSVSLSEFNKVINISGLRLYTDDFYIRATTSQPAGLASVYTSAVSASIMHTSMIQHRRLKHARSLANSQEGEISSHDLLGEPDDLHSDPVLFAQFCTDKTIVRARLKVPRPRTDPACSRPGTSAFSKEDVQVDVEGFFGALHVFITPTQLSLLRTLFTKPHTSCPPPSLQDSVPSTECLAATSPPKKTSQFRPGNLLGVGGTWSSPRQDDMYSVASLASAANNSTEAKQFTSIMIQAEPRLPGTEEFAATQREIRHANFGKSVKVKLRLSNIVVQLVLDGQSDHADGRVKFFAGCPHIPIGSGTVLKDVRAALHSLTNLHCIQVLAAPFVVDMHQHGSASKAVTRHVTFTSANCELIECLVHEQAPTEYNEILCFDREAATTQPDIVMKYSASTATSGSILTVDCSCARTELDPTAIDRFLKAVAGSGKKHPNLELRTNFFDDLNEPLVSDSVLSNNPEHQSPLRGPDRGLPIVVNIAKWIMVLRIPVNNSSSVDSSSRPLRAESLTVELSKAVINTKLSPSLSLNGGAYLQFDDALLSLRSPDLGAVSLAKIVGKAEMSAKWRFGGISDLLSPPEFHRNSSTDHFGGKSVIHAFDGISAKNDVQVLPFSKRVTIHENEELLIIGDSSELSAFADECLASAPKLDINLRCSGRLYIAFDNKEVYDLLYNCLQDLARWSPRSKDREHLHSADFGAVALQPSVHVKGLMESSVSQDSESVEEDDLPSGAPQMKVKTPTGSRSRLTFSIEAQSVDVVLSFQEMMSPDVVVGSQIHMQLQNAKAFSVDEKLGIPNEHCVFLSSRTVVVSHRTGLVENTTNTLSELITANFRHRGTPWTCVAERVPSFMSLSSEDQPDENDFSLALHGKFVPDQLRKECVLAIGLRRTLLYHSFSHTWINQLVAFFNVPSEETDQHLLATSPRTLLELHLHCWSSCVQYRPESCDVSARLHLDSFDVSSNIVYGASSLRLHFIAEDAALSITTQMESHAGGFHPSTPFVCVTKFDLFDLVILQVDHGIPGGRILRTPEFEVSIPNLNVSVHTCADSFAALVRLLVALDQDMRSSAATQNEIEMELGGSDLDLVGTLSDTNLSTDSTACIEQLIDNALESVDDKACSAVQQPTPSRHVQPSSRQDDEFCVVNVQSSAVPRGSGDAPSLDELALVEDYFAPPIPRSDQLLPSSSNMPQSRCTLRDATICWHMYGGRDFETSHNPCEPLQPFSRAKSRNPAYREKVSHARRSPYTCGGPLRDHTVHVEVQLQKLSIVLDQYDTDPIAYRHILLQDIEIRDRLMASNINKFLYRYDFSGDATEHLPILDIEQKIFKSTSMENFVRESSLDVALLSVRLNVDQDTLEFLQCFFDDVSGLDIGMKDHGGAPFRGEKTEVVTRLGSEARSLLEQPSEASSDRNDQTEADWAEVPVNVASAPDVVTSIISTMSSEPGTSAADLLAESIHEATMDIDAMDFGHNQPAILRSSLEIADDAASTSTDVAQDPLEQFEVSSEGALYFTSVKFSPTCVVRVDYHGKRVSGTGGFQGLLAGLAQLHHSDLKLKEINCRQGLRGWPKVITHLTNQWLVDIKQNQFSSIIGAVGPMHCLTELAQSVRDLVYLPYAEMRAVDGCVARGVRRGTAKFAFSTAATTVDLASRVMSVIQNVSEFAFDVTNPIYPGTSPTGGQLVGTSPERPIDTRQGITMAYDSLRLGYQERRSAVEGAMTEERSRGHWSGRGVLRHAVPTLLKVPLVACQASKHVLTGLHYQLKPSSRNEQTDKWKRLD